MNLSDIKKDTLQKIKSIQKFRVESLVESNKQILIDKAFEDVSSPDWSEFHEQRMALLIPLIEAKSKNPISFITVLDGIPSIP